jgi:hypothetical protein
MSENASGKFWRVSVKGARKAHLTLYEQGRGSGDVALCGKQLPADQRRAASSAITTPMGNECHICLQWAGFAIKRTPVPPKVKSQQDEKYRLLTNFIRDIGKTKLNTAGKRTAIEMAIQLLRDST